MKVKEKHCAQNTWSLVSFMNSFLTTINTFGVWLHSWMLMAECFHKIIVFIYSITKSVVLILVPQPKNCITISITDVEVTKPCWISFFNPVPTPYSFYMQTLFSYCWLSAQSVAPVYGKHWMKCRRPKYILNDWAVYLCVNQFTFRVIYFLMSFR